MWLYAGAYVSTFIATNIHTFRDKCALTRKSIDSKQNINNANAANHDAMSLPKKMQAKGSKKIQHTHSRWVARFSLSA